MNEDFDDEAPQGPQAQLIDVLALLWEAHRTATDQQWSLAKLSKRATLPMSSLRRLLTELELADLVAVTTHPDGTGFAVLTEQGVEMCTELFDGVNRP